MCKFILIINKNKKNNDTLRKLVHANVTDLKKEADGFAVYRDGNQYFSMEYESVHDDIEYKGEEIYMTHFRTKTAGSRDLSGLHLQRLDQRFIFMHNGSTNIQVETKSDSYYFFEGMVRGYRGKIDENAVQCDIEDYRFLGRGVLYDEKKDIFHLFSTSWMYAYYLPDCVIFSSYRLTTKYEWFKWIDILGFPVAIPEKEDLEFIGERTYDSEYIRIDKKQFAYKTELETTTTQWPNYNSWQGNSYKHNKKKHKQQGSNMVRYKDGKVYHYVDGKLVPYELPKNN